MSVKTLMEKMLSCVKSDNSAVVDGTWLEAVVIFWVSQATISLLTQSFPILFFFFPLVKVKKNYLSKQ